MKTRMGSLTTIMGRMDCALSLAGRPQNQLNLS